jgi:hypothetical protein
VLGRIQSKGLFRSSVSPLQDPSLERPRAVRRGSILHIVFFINKGLRNINYIKVCNIRCIIFIACPVNDYTVRDGKKEQSARWVLFPDIQLLDPVSRQDDTQDFTFTKKKE